MRPETPTWFQLGGGEGWVREVRRQLTLADGRCWRTPQQERFKALCRRLEPWRLRSSVHCNMRAVDEILPMLEAARLHQGRLQRPGSFAADPGWTRAEFGELIVEARNRKRLWALGRLEAKPKGPRFDVDRIPLERIEMLIQRHPNMELVERLRAARNRRIQA